MRLPFALFCLATFSMTTTILAQTSAPPPPPSGPIHVVTYVETNPEWSGKAIAALHD